MSYAKIFEGWVRIAGSGTIEDPYTFDRSDLETKLGGQLPSGALVIIRKYDIQNRQCYVEVITVLT